MGDKSPKSKERQKKQDLVRKTQEARAAVAKAALSSATASSKTAK